MRFGQQGTLTRVWSKTGAKPRIAVQTEYDWVYIFGAACPLTGETADLVWKYLREHCLFNRVFKDYDELIDSGCAAWNYLV